MDEDDEDSAIDDEEPNNIIVLEFPSDDDEESFKTSYLYREKEVRRHLGSKKAARQLRVIYDDDTDFKSKKSVVDLEFTDEMSMNSVWY
jgi:hypothetical protein